MNKKLIISLLLIGLLFTQAPLRAQTRTPLIELPGAGLTPDSFFYFLDEWGEGIQEFFTFSDEGKAQLQASLIGERVSEIKIMFGREDINPRDIRVAFDKIDSHADRSSVSLERLKVRRVNITPLAATLANETDAWERHLDIVIKNSRRNLTVLANAERKILTQRMDDPRFILAMEVALRNVSGRIDYELGRPLTNFTVVSFNRDVDDDTYSSTYRAENATIVNLIALRNRILARNISHRWESGDVALDNDSLDITFEKAYPPVTIDGIKLIPEASVTISVTTHSPRRNMTSINYDRDITLETEHEWLANYLEDLLDKVKEDLDDLSDDLEEQMDARSAALKAIRDAEEAKQELIDEAAEEGINISARAFEAFNVSLTQARSAFVAGNYREARRLAERAEDALEKVEEILEELEEKLEEVDQAERALKRSQRRLEQAPMEARRELEKELEEARKRYQERLKEIERERVE